jgi:hypothetical protein
MRTIMKDLDQIPHHPAIEALVDTLCSKTQNSDRSFFRIVAAYFLAKMAASMRAKILTKDRGEIPVNVYAVALATSGFGKGHSVNILETDFLGKFRKRFMEDTFPLIADDHLWKRAIEMAATLSTPEADEKEKLDKEFQRLGALAFSFDSGTPAAIKQMRQKLLMANIGAINFQMDEIGSNLSKNEDVLDLYLELYDQGIVKQKLTKNTNENQRGEEIEGKTPTNALLFGTPAKLLDGGPIEDLFYSFLDTGYARRCIFGWGVYKRADDTRTAAEIYAQRIQPQIAATANVWADHFELLADPVKFDWKMEVDDPVGIELLDYKMTCERLADKLPEHEEIRKAELSHRYFKALKLAGAFAFVEESPEVTMDHLYSAIKLVEESGLAFDKMMTREKNYVRLAKYIASVKTDLTQADIQEALPFFKGSTGHRNDMMNLAASWGYKRHIIIRKTFNDGIEFYSGETLEETDTNKIRISWSDHFAYNYQTEEAPFDQLHKMTQAQGLHWANHGFQGGHRSEEKTIPGFNLLAIDVDGGVSLSTVHDLMKDYQFMTYTTKRHNDQENRFRLMLPINYVLHLDHEDYKQFMNNVMLWLPFKTDESANQRSKKWETFPGTYHYNLQGEIFDCLPFIPKTSKNESYQRDMKPLESLDNLERWFAQHIASGNRNNQMLRYAMALADSGMNFIEIERSVLSFNARLNSPLDSEELRNTVLVSVAKKLAKAA